MNPGLHDGPAARLIRLLVYLFFTVYLALGLMLVKDYGMTWDDEYVRERGLVVMDYFNDLSGSRLLDHPLSEYKLDTYYNRHYGTAFQTAAVMLERAFGFDDPREWFLLRHYMTFLVWFIALVFFYKLLHLRFRNPALSLVGVIFMILSPRIFADAFYNSKDIVFLSFYIIGTYTLIKFIRRPSWKTAFWFALASALLIDTRILGVILPFTGMIFIALMVLIPYNSKSKTQNSKLKTQTLIPNTLYYFLFLFVLTVFFWPYLWENPFGRLIESFRTMGHFPWDDPVLYWGKFIPATHLPFHYILSWIVITTPILYSVFFLAGIGFVFIHPIKKYFEEDHLADLVHLVLFFLPLLAVIVLHSTLYDGWRQMFFLYGPFMMLAMVGFEKLLQRCKGLKPVRVSRFARLLLFILMAWSTGSVMVFMIRYHPNQNVYFNFLAGKETTRDFEADYWGLSYRQALEYILQNDSRDSIPVFSINYPGRANALILPPGQRKRLVFTDPGQADYWVSNYRFPGEHYRYFHHEPPYDRPLWERRVRGNPIVGVYRNKD